MNPDLGPRFTDPACKGVDPNVFFPNTGGAAGKKHRDAALAYCHRCPHMTECRDYAVDHMTNQSDFGIWGGTNAEERRTLRRAKTRRTIGEGPSIRGQVIELAGWRKGAA